MAQYKLTNKAVEDLNGIWDYTANKWSEEQADKYYNMLLDSCQDIANSPDLKAVLYVKENGKITNSDYQTLNEVSRETATRDLKELIDKHLIKSSGQKGAGAFYTLE